MKTLIIITALFASQIFSQGFEAAEDKVQTFYFNESMKQNQASFFSTTPLEDINGLTEKIGGEVSINLKNLKSLKGKIILPVASLKTGIRQMEKDLRSSSWLDEEKFPEIVFTVKELKSIEKISGNKLKAEAVGEFKVKGKSNVESADVVLTFFKESEKTKERMPGDLLLVEVSFSVSLKNYGVKHLLLGERVADKIDIKANLIGSNKK